MIFNRELLARFERHGLKAPASILNRKGDDAELYLYNAIGSDVFSHGITATDVVERLKECSGAKNLAIHINSPGGDVFDGIAIHAALSRFPGKKTVYVDGIAASIASVIAMAGDRIVMAPGSEMMIHEAHTVCAGNAEQLRKVADRCDQANANIRGIYAAKTKQKDEDLQALMRAETFMPAEQAVTLGFADCIEDGGRPPLKNQLTLKTLSPIEVARLRRDLEEARQH